MLVFRAVSLSPTVGEEVIDFYMHEKSSEMRKHALLETDGAIMTRYHSHVCIPKQTAKRT